MRPEDQLEVRERPARPPGDHLGVLTGAAAVPSPTSSFNHHTSSSLDAHIHERAEADYHYRSEYPMQDQPTPAQQRITALRAIADLAEQHQLPAPKQVSFSPTEFTTPYIQLRLDDNDADGVSAWTNVLNLGPAETSEPMQRQRGEDCFVSVKAGRFDHEGHNAWIGYTSAEVWSACDRTEAGEQA